MAALTKLDTADLADLARRFDLGDVVRWQAVEAGTINSNYRFESERGRYFLRVNEGKSTADVEYEARLVEQLADFGVLTPVPVPARADGRPYVEHEGKLVSVFPWMDGEHLDGAALQRGHVAVLGHRLAALHKAGDLVRGLPERFGIYTFEAMVERAEAVRAAQDPALAAVLGLLFDEIDWQHRSKRPSAPPGIVHGDLFPDNVLWQDDEISALLDFEQASLGDRVYDLAVCVNAWCFREDFEQELVSALVAAYSSAAGPIDVEELYAQLRRAAWRFTITRITDVYQRGDSNPSKDYRRYQRRLQRWRELGPSWLGAR